MAQQPRPLSPFMLGSAYRFQYTSSLSFLHRMSGVYLSFGILVLVYWLSAAASGEAAYEQALRQLQMPVSKVGLFLWLLAFWYHFLNGLRHLGWDLGYGFEKVVARNTGTLVFVGSIVLTLLTWWWAVASFATTVGAAP